MMHFSATETDAKRSPPSSPSRESRSIDTEEEPSLFPIPATPAFNGSDRYLVCNICGELNKYSAPSVPIDHKPSVLIPVSINAENCDSVHMSILMHSIKKMAKKAVVIVADQLHTFDVQLEKGISLEAAIFEVNNMGDQWVRECDPIFRRSNIEVNVIKWKTLLSQDECITARSYIHSLNIRGNPFNQALRKTIEIFIRRKKKQMSKLGREFNDEFEGKYRESCQNYLMEEATVFLLFPQYECDYLVYPYKETPIIKYLREEVLPAYVPRSKPIKWAETKFKKEDYSETLDRELRGSLKDDRVFRLLQITLSSAAECIRSLTPKQQWLAVTAAMARFEKLSSSARRAILVEERKKDNIVGDIDTGMGDGGEDSIRETVLPEGAERLPSALDSPRVSTTNLFTTPLSSASTVPESPKFVLDLKDDRSGDDTRPSSSLSCSITSDD